MTVQYAGLSLYFVADYLVSVVNMVVMLALYLVMQMLMIMLSHLIWLQEGHAYEALGIPFLQRSWEYYSGPFWDDVAGFFRWHYRQTFHGQEESEESERRQEIAADPDTAAAVYEPVEEEVLRHMLEIMSRDAIFWFSESGKGWDVEAQRQVMVMKQKLDRQVQEQQDLIEEHERTRKR